MSNSNSKLSEIELGVDQLIEKIGAMSSLIKSQEDRIGMLTEQINGYVTENDQLRNLNQELIRKAQEVDHTKASTEAKIDEEAYNHKINELVKEINACISLLNK